MSKTLTLRLDDESYRFLAAAAKAENRSITNLVETAALAKIQEWQFVDDFEMDEIAGDADLLERMKRGSQDARERRGSFVE